jgi:hypothetical protein
MNLNHYTIVGLIWVMVNPAIVESIKEKFGALGPVMNERVCRHWAAAEARALGRGGVTAVCCATGLSRNTVAAGLKELGQCPAAPETEALSRVRRPGGGRKPLTDRDPMLVRDLHALVDPVTRGDPESPLRWTCKSTRNLAEELNAQGHSIGERTVARLLEEMKFSLQSTRKTKEGSSHADRNAQFEYINAQVLDFQKRGQPAISVDTKKKELIGDFHNKGQEWQPQGAPEEVKVHDFEDKELGKAIPYGVYDITQNQGWVSVGIDHDTARFAAATIRRWWNVMGRPTYPEAKELLIAADGDGSNSARSRLWKIALQELADAIGLKVTVCHLPPGTSKWNKIEHRMFCHITENWRGRPLRSLEVIVNLIGNTRTTAGLRITADVDPARYETGIKVSDEELATVSVTKADFHGDWNYTIHPRNKG